MVRQLRVETSHAAKGAMVIGAMPMPAETSDTARLRWVSNQPVTQAIIGTMMAAALPPTRSPKINWNARSEVAWDASARLTARMIAPGQDNRARTEPIGEAAPGDAAERHGEKADGHGARHAGHRPAGVPGDGLQQNGQREHGSDRNAAQKAARCNDHPSVGRFGHSLPYQLVGILVKSHSNASNGDDASACAMPESDANSD